MAILKNKLKANIEGMYYVDNQCLRCCGCVVRAPEFFEMSKEGAFVKKQPYTQEEKESCDKALIGCPAKAIGIEDV